MESREHSDQLTWDYLTEREQEVLGELCAFRRAFEKYDWHPEGARPMDVGGTNGSHHSYTLGKLVKKGLADHRKGLEWGKSSTRYRGSKQYRATDRGMQVEKSRRSST